MSPNVGNFVHDLVEMAKAMETLPQVQAQLDDINRQNSHLNNQIEALKADLQQSRNYAATLEQRNHDLEVARDDAELRFLELDEKANKVLVLFDHIKGLAGEGEQRLTPPKPPEPAQEVQGQQVQSEAPPISNSVSMEHPAEASGGGLEAPQPPASQGQSEVNPTTVSSEAQSQSAGSATMDNASQSGKDGEATKPSGPYTGKRYYDHPVYIPFADWMAGGGTRADYDWRPNLGASA